MARLAESSHHCQVCREGASIGEESLVDIENREEFEAWLRGQPREASVALAARAALRVLPIVQRAGKEFRRQDEFLEHFVLPVLRATGIAWSAAQYPDQAIKLNACAADAFVAAVDAPGKATSSYRSSALAVGAAEAAFAAGRAAAAAAPNVPSAAYPAMTVFANAAVAAAYAAAAASDASTALRADIDKIESGQTAKQIIERRLWSEIQPPSIAELWAELKRDLLAANQDWDVWTEWYEARLRGDPTNEALEIARATIPDYIWEQGPAVVNAKIKGLIAEHEPPKSSPPEPLPELGPVLLVTERGLELISHSPGAGFDLGLQKVLHDRLRRLLPALKDATHKVANAHPAFDHLISEYSDLIAQPFENLDVASVWAVGTGLLAFRAAFAAQASGAMTEPLEPGHLALLQQAAEIHGGFILGFPLGRELTDRADHSRFSPELIARITPVATQILEKLARAKDFVETRTRNFLAVTDENLLVHGWETARTGHAAYAVTRNSLIALGRVLIRANSILATVAGGILLDGADPGLQMTQHIIRFMLENAQIVASFAEPFPELRNWFGFIIDHIDREKQ